MKKWLMYGVIGVVALMVIGAMTGGDDDAPADTAAPVPTTAAADVPTDAPAEPTAEPEPTDAPAVANGITLENFNKLETGMTYAAAVAILGAEGEVMSETDIGGYKTIMYVWKAPGGIANMNAMFQNDALNSKAQFGLK